MRMTNAVISAAVTGAALTVITGADARLPWWARGGGAHGTVVVQVGTGQPGPRQRRRHRR
ncbi:hypothetical protein [Asanoa ishikariensis]|uniref:hypothetical protein n=1 Tax=Asanoa ishikariensis TaxID=137265 RepID=UPI00115FE4B9|nr:hypothetical protein [Asanoa ishikariensis]